MEIGVRAPIFLSTLSLRRATQQAITAEQTARISIHALLAESDPRALCIVGPSVYFYPRSPCGERRSHYRSSGPLKRFLSTLSLRRATAANGFADAPPQISIHALLAESDPRSRDNSMGRHISIHALLAESDSGCGQYYIRAQISIHALLAESDDFRTL